MIHPPVNDTNEATWLGKSIFRGPWGKIGKKRWIKYSKFAEKPNFLAKLIISSLCFNIFSQWTPKYWIAQPSGLICIILRSMDHQKSQLLVFWLNQLAKMGIKIQLCQISIQIQMSPNEFKNAKFNKLDIDSQMSGTCGQYEPLNSS